MFARPLPPEPSSSFVRHVPCDSCGSRDGGGLYDDGHTTCFVCGAYSSTNKSTVTQRRHEVDTQFLEGDYQSLGARRLSETACRKFGYKVGHDRQGRPAQIADYRDQGGSLVAQKVRLADKTFSIITTGGPIPLFGQHLWGDGGRRLVITEGELDAISAAQAFGLNWPVVSVPTGSKGAKKALLAQIEWVERFDSVVFCFDMDEPGRAAAAECAALLTPGRAMIAELPRKDASDMLVAGEIKELMTAIYQARAYRPGGIVNGADLWAKISEKQEPGKPYPWDGLTRKTNGRMPGTLTTWTAGTGAGKSTILRQIAYEGAYPKADAEPSVVGCIMLEESVGRSAQGFLSHHLGMQTHIAGTATETQLKAAFDATLAKGNVFFHDHFGSLDGADLVSKMRYLAKGCGCKLLILDHISIAVSGNALESDERRGLDKLMTDLRSLVEETQIELHLISHLKRAQGESHEEGGRVTLAHLRGTQSIAQLSDMVIAIERNNQDPNGKMTVRVLKNRATGETGVACRLDYNRKTGHLFEVAEAFEETVVDDDVPF